MAKISFFLVFSIVLALPFRSVIGQDWNELVSQAGLTQQSLDEAKKAIGAANGMANAAAGQEALNDYFGGGSEDVGEVGSSLADLLDNEGNNIIDAVSPSAIDDDLDTASPSAIDDDLDVASPSPINIVDPPRDQIGEMLDAQETPDGDPIFDGPTLEEEAPTSSPSESPISEAPGYAAPSKAPAANAPSRAPAAAANAPKTNAPSRAPTANAPKTNAPSRAPTANAPIKTPKLAPTNEAAEAPEDAGEIEDEDEDAEPVY